MEKISNAHPMIILFSQLEAMEFHHLPVAGGWWDQSPQFVEYAQVLFSEKAKAEKERQEKQEREQRAQGRRGLR